MHPNEELIRRFYEALNAGDGQTMASAYAEDARFSDPVFPELEGAGAGAMWRMLTENSDDLKVEATVVKADDSSGKARWEAVYSFGPGKRRVHNVIEATFEFRDGKIVHHEDRFDFWRWSRQALGPVGIFLGWTPMVKSQVRTQAARSLRKWREKQGEV